MLNCPMILSDETGTPITLNCLIKSNLLV